MTNQPEVVNDFADATLALLGEHAIDMTLFFDTLTRVAGDEPDAALLELFSDTAVAQQWLTQWHGLRADGADTARRMRRANPVVIARNHRVEEALQAATTRNDLTPFLRLTAALQNPFHCAPEHADLANSAVAGGTGDGDVLRYLGTEEEGAQKVPTCQALPVDRLLSTHQR